MFFSDKCVILWGPSLLFFQHDLFQSAQLKFLLRIPTTNWVSDSLPCPPWMWGTTDNPNGYNSAEDSYQVPFSHTMSLLLSRLNKPSYFKLSLQVISFIPLISPVAVLQAPFALPTFLLSAVTTRALITVQSNNCTLCLKWTFPWIYLTHYVIT